MTTTKIQPPALPTEQTISSDSNRVRIKVKKLSPNAILPRPAKEGDAAVDIFALENAIVHTTKVIRTGIAFGGLHCPLSKQNEKYSFVKIESRSGLAARGVFVTGGIIDNGYRGELKVVLNNTNPYKEVEIMAGDRIAQLVVYMHHPAMETLEVTELDETERGVGGFGSTGR